MTEVYFKQEYVSNACPDCDEMQEDYYLRHVINSGDLTYSEYYETTLARSAVRRRKWILLNGKNLQNYCPSRHSCSSS